MSDDKEREALVSRALELQVEVKEKWATSYLKRVVTMAENNSAEQDAKPVHHITDEKMFPVKLLRNYQIDPERPYEVLEKGKLPDRCSDRKGRFWVDTVIRLPIEEARRLMNNKVLVPEQYRDPITNEKRVRHTEVAMPLAVRADEFTI